MISSSLTPQLPFNPLILPPPAGPRSPSAGATHTSAGRTSAGAACDDTYRVHDLFVIPNNYHEPDLTLLSDLRPCHHASGHALPHAH